MKSMIKVVLVLLTIYKPQRLVVARFALQELYREQTIAYIITQSQMHTQNSNNKIQSQISTEELRFAKRINRIGATKLKLRSKEFRKQICLKPNFNLSKSCSSLLTERGARDKDFGVGFTGFRLTVKKLRGFEDQGLICDKKIADRSPMKNKTEKEKSIRRTSANRDERANSFVKTNE